MTATSELNLSALWDLPTEQQDSAIVRRVAAGSYVSTATSHSPRFEYGTYVTITGRVHDTDQPRGQYVTGSITSSAASGTYTSR